jgi:osmotically-inducible protein OsmY
MSDEELIASVTDELAFDPKVDEGAIAVSADRGTVTLRGTVGSFREKREAKKAARRIKGVGAVDDELQVRLLIGQARRDADLRGDILRGMAVDSSIPSTIEVVVVDGYVTLKGTAAWKHQSDEAETVAGRVDGVVGVDNFIELTTPELHAEDVQKTIEKAVERNAKIDANALTVITHDTTVELEGSVRSFSEHDAALATAWATPGVLDVKDRLTVSS